VSEEWWHRGEQAQRCCHLAPDRGRRSWWHQAADGKTADTVHGCWQKVEGAAAVDPHLLPLCLDARRVAAPAGWLDVLLHEVEQGDCVGQPVGQVGVVLLVQLNLWAKKDRREAGRRAFVKAAGERRAPQPCKSRCAAPAGLPMSGLPDTAAPHTPHTRLMLDSALCAHQDNVHTPWTQPPHAASAHHTTDHHPASTPPPPPQHTPPHQTSEV
jgi:hypothetical protein